MPTAPTQPKLRRSADPPGYWIGAEFHAGFPDDPSLTTGQRRRIAAWARAIAPEALDERQQALLNAKPPAPSATQKRAAKLAGYEGSPFWDLLDERQRALVRDPGKHPDLPEAGYPLGVGQLATLVGATPDKVRHWHNSGLIPARRTAGRHREFYAAAAVRAFYLNALSRAGIALLRDLKQGRGGLVLVGMSSVLYDRASATPQPDHDLLQRAATDLQRVGTELLSSS